MTGRTGLARVRPTATSAVVGAALGLMAAMAWPASDPETGHGGLPAPAAGALDVRRPHQLGTEPHVSIWATVRRPARARARPNRRAEPVAAVRTRTPEGTDNAVLILERRRDPSGRVWVRARLPVLPNGTTGWLPRAVVAGYRVVRTHLVVDRDRMRLTLFRRGRGILRAPVGVGRTGWPTPAGRFYVRNKLLRYRSTFYGPLAFGTSARSPTADDWPGGGFVGIHGTNRPGLIPGRVSHGCIRMRNHDILRLGRLMPVGTPITIR
jgi:lipoprotein-anchoring transpeptidase ErfK/SrfK